MSTDFSLKLRPVESILQRPLGCFSVFGASYRRKPRSLNVMQLIVIWRGSHVSVTVKTQSHQTENKESV